MGANFGIAGLDWQQRINWDRLRKYRTERARERMKAAGLGVDLEGPGQVAVSLAHDKVQMLVNALGPPPPDVIAEVHERGLIVGGLVGNRQHAERQVAMGVDVIVAQGTEAGGHVCPRCEGRQSVVPFWRAADAEWSIGCCWETRP